MGFGHGRHFRHIEQAIVGWRGSQFGMTGINDAPVNLFVSPPWLDDGLDIIEQLIRLDIEIHILEKARDRLSEELRITSQRVNLFEKVKIPQTKEHIRVIRISLGDEQAAAVSRAKIAKTMRLEKESSMA